ncbi:MAG: DNA polymerase III subunit beta [Bifidobacteriaceae bacterium]|jgi:DNA polymerase-3 subunit beta|nr:DNA polymerase III subunit beta [Bifidobacteriaceae bacterium]
MKFRLERDVLADAVTWVARALPTRPPAPVLAGVRLTARPESGGSLALSSFDYEVSARAEVQAAVEEPGEALVPGKLLADISRLLPDKPVDFTVEGSKAVVACGASTFTLPRMPIEDYPTLPAMPQPAGVLNAGVFAEAVQQAAVAATKDETLPLLTGVRLEIEGEKMTLLATDRYRLAIREIRWTPGRPDISGVALVRAKTLHDVARSFAHTEEISIALAADSGADIIGFEAGGRHTTSLLIDGDYPSVRKLLPEASPIQAVVSVPALMEAVRRVSLVAERNTPLQISFSEGQAVLNAGTGDDAQASEVIEATLEGDDIAVAFNPAYLIEGLGVMTAPLVRLSMSHPNKPVLFEGVASVESQTSGEHLYLLVPIRFSG